MGRCADHILKDRPDTLHVFIHADDAYRAQRIVRLYGETEKSPKKRLSDKDGRRAANYKHFTGKDWGMSENYDLSLNSAKMGEEACIELLTHLVQTSFS